MAPGIGLAAKTSLASSFFVDVPQRRLAGRTGDAFDITKAAATSFAAVSAASGPLVAGLATEPTRRTKAAFSAAIIAIQTQPAPRKLPAAPIAPSLGAFLDVGPIRQRRTGVARHAANSATLLEALSGRVAILRTFNKSRLGDFLSGPEDDTSTVLRQFRYDSTPRMSMMGGFTAGEKAGMLVERFMNTWLMRKIDFTEFGQDDPELPLTGWTRLAPRFLRFNLIFDLIAIVTLLISQNSICDQPLRLWLLGGLFLGLPTTWLTDQIVKLGPRYTHYRLRTTMLRNGKSDKESLRQARIEGLKVYDNIGAEMDEADFVYRYQDGHFMLDMERGRTMVTAYRVVTDRSADRSLDPISWVFEGSYNGIDWEVLDEQNNVNLPTARGAVGDHMDDMMHLNDSHTVFRLAWYAEVAATVASFVWLVWGTAKVNAGVVECIDGAPELYYPCWLLVVLTWSMLTTGSLLIIVSAVATVISGARRDPNAT
jgi:hypothetical protein